MQVWHDDDADRVECSALDDDDDGDLESESAADIRERDDDIARGARLGATVGGW